MNSTKQDKFEFLSLITIEIVMARAVIVRTSAAAETYHLITSLIFKFA